MKRHLILGISSSVLGLLLVGLVVWGLSFNATQTQAAAPATPQQGLWEEDFSEAISPSDYYTTSTPGSGLVTDESFLLTQDDPSQRGRIFHTTPAMMTEFDATFSLYLGASPDGADGVAFNICPSYDYPPDMGGTLDASCPGGYIVAFDTWGEVTPATVYLAKDNVFNRLRTADLPTSLEDGLWHDAEVLFNQGKITVTLDNADVIAGFAIPDYEPFFGYFGFSGATGYYYNEQRVDTIQVQADFLPLGYLDGHVSDADTMAPIEGATVTGDRVGGGDWSTETDASGYYSMTVATGIYTVTAEHDPYFPVSIPEVEVLPDDVTSVFFNLTAKVAFDPSPVHVTLNWQTTGSEQASLTNRMIEPYDYELLEVPGGFLPMLAPGDFIPLKSSPVPLTCVASDPETGFIYAQQDGGTGFYRYDPWQDSWIQLADSPLNSGNNGGAKVLDGKIYTVYTSFSSMGIYDITTGTWSVIDNGLGEGTGNIATDGEYLYLVVGYNFSRYDPIGEIWAPLASPPIAFQLWGGLDVLDGVIYGHTGNGSTGFAKYDIVDDIWTPLPALPNGAVLGSAIDPGARVYYAYGDYGGDNWYAFDIDVGTWSQGTNPLFTTSDGGMAFVGQNGISGIYVVEGESGLGFARFETKPFGAGIPWLSESPISGTVPAGGTQDLNLDFAATVAAGIDQPGDYFGTLLVIGDPRLGVPVTMTVNPSPDMGKVTGTILDNCTGEAVRAEIGIAGGYPITQTISDLHTGEYTAWLVAGSYVLTFSAMDYITQEESVEISAGGTTLLEISLVPDRPCITVEPGELEAWVLQDTEVYIHSTGLDITDDGGQDLEFEIGEIPWIIDMSNPASQPVSSNNPSPKNNRATSMYTGKQPFITSLMSPGDFIDLANSPGLLTCVAADPVTGFIYAQEYYGVAFYQYDPWANSWIQLKDSPLNSGNDGGAKVLNGKVYTVYTDNATQMGVYDISTNTWSTIINGLGMGTGNIATEGEYLYLVVGSTFARYDPIGDIWAPLAGPPIAFEPWGGLDLLDGVIYGHTGNGTTGFAKYDIASDIWTPLLPVPDGAVLGSAIDPVARKYYAYGNYGGNKWYTFDIDTETWSFGINPLFDVDDGGMAFVSHAGISGIYFVQGEVGTGFGRLETVPIVVDVPWVWEEPVVGTVTAGNTDNVEILFTSIVTDPLPLGTYSATLVIINTDPVARTQFVPTTMHVVSEYTTPSAAFATNAPVCPGAEVMFTNTTLPGIPPVNTYQWDFGDGASSTEENPTHLYAAPGVYEVTLEACNIEDLCDSATASVDVLGLPQANFSYDAEGVAVSFTNLSLYATGYNWNFGDGTNSTQVNPIHSYPAIGTYTVALAAMGVCGDDEFSAQVRAGSFIYLPVVTKEIQP